MNSAERDCRFILMILNDKPKTFWDYVATAPAEIVGAAIDVLFNVATGHGRYDSLATPRARR